MSDARFLQDPDPPKINFDFDITNPIPVMVLHITRNLMPRDYEDMKTELVNMWGFSLDQAEVLINEVRQEAISSRTDGSLPTMDADGLD